MWVISFLFMVERCCSQTVTYTHSYHVSTSVLLPFHQHAYILLNSIHASRTPNESTLEYNACTSIIMCIHVFPEYTQEYVHVYTCKHTMKGILLICNLSVDARNYCIPASVSNCPAFVSLRVY